MPRLKSPLRQIAPKTMAWRRWRQLQYGLLAARCRGICEGCGTWAALEPHHVIGREEEPWASLSELLAGLCRTCHRKVTGELGRGIDVGLRARLADKARERLTQRFSLTSDSTEAALRKLKRTHTFDPIRCQIIPID